MSLCPLALAAGPRPARADGLIEGSSGGSGGAPVTLGRDLIRPVEARYYERLGDGRTRCLVCPNGCVRSSGERSRCRARENRDGTYYSLVYGLPSVVHFDAVEKSPLYHFHPGLKMFSIATAGCNLACRYCQNWQFSQSRPEEARAFRLTPREAVAKAREGGSESMAYFYTDPTIYIEYAYDMAVEARRQGLKNVMITAGYIRPEPLKDLCRVMDAFTVGLKGFDEDYYRDVVGGGLEPVKEALVTIRREGAWLEVVNLVVPTLNDDPARIRAMATWIRGALGADTPLHFTRFVPMYRLTNLPATPVAALEAAWEAAKGAGLEYVYIGNLPGHRAANTRCAGCGTELVLRVGFKTLRRALPADGRCPRCSRKIPGVWTA